MGLHSRRRVEFGLEKKKFKTSRQKEEHFLCSSRSSSFSHLSVKENILYGIKARNLDEQVYEEYVHLLIHEMKVEHLLERYPANLSGGEKKGWPSSEL